MANSTENNVITLNVWKITEETRGITNSIHFDEIEFNPDEDNFDELFVEWWNIFKESELECPNYYASFADFFVICDESITFKHGDRINDKIEHADFSKSRNLHQTDLDKSSLGVYREEFKKEALECFLNSVEGRDLRIPLTGEETEEEIEAIKDEVEHALEVFCCHFCTGDNYLANKAELLEQGEKDAIEEAVMAWAGFATEK